MNIYLLKPLSDAQESLLKKIGIIFATPKLLKVPDTRNLYCKKNYDNGENHYSIFYLNDEQPVAEFFINNSIIIKDNFQLVEIHETEIESRLGSDLSTVANNNFEQRKQEIANGKYGSLFATPFSELRFDEQVKVSQISYRREGEEKYYPLSAHGLKIVELIRSSAEALKCRNSVVGGKDARQNYIARHEKILNDLYEGKHPLTLLMQPEEIQSYFRIAHNEIMPSDFQEPMPGIDQLGQKINQIIDNGLKSDCLAVYQDILEEYSSPNLLAFPRSQNNFKTLKKIVDELLQPEPQANRIAALQGELNNYIIHNDIRSSSPWHKLNASLVGIVLIATGVVACCTGIGSAHGVFMITAGVMAILLGGAILKFSHWPSWPNNPRQNAEPDPEGAPVPRFLR